MEKEIDMSNLKERLLDYSKRYHPPISDDLILAKYNISGLEQENDKLIKFYNSVKAAIAVDDTSFEYLVEKAIEEYEE